MAHSRAVFIYRPHSHWQGATPVAFEFRVSVLLKFVQAEIKQLIGLPAGQWRDHLLSCDREERRCLQIMAKSKQAFEIGGDGKIAAGRGLGRKQPQFAYWLDYQVEAKRYRRVYCPHCATWHWRKAVKHEVQGSGRILTPEIVRQRDEAGHWHREGGGGDGHMTCPRRHLLLEYFWKS